MIKDMKIVRREDDEDVWDIFISSNIEPTGRIEIHHYLSRNTKKLYYKEFEICNVANQKEALENLEKFLNDRKIRIEIIVNEIRMLKEDLPRVKNYVTSTLINKEVEIMEELYDDLINDRIK